MRYATGCRCSNPLCFVDEPEHCFRCGRGPYPTSRVRRAGRRRRLPDDLGALQREGRRPDPHLENVVRFDRLRPGPRLAMVSLVDPEPNPVELTYSQELMLSLAADGLSNAQIANVLGTTTANVGSTLAHTYQRIGLLPGSPGPNSPTRAAAVEWWQSRRRDPLDEAA